MAKNPKQSAGILMYRWVDAGLQVLLVHPGGPMWAKKNEGSWTIPKGQYEDGEEPLAAAIREFYEETGFEAAGPFVELGTVRQKSGKVVTAWATEGDCDPALLISNTCRIEWPPRSGKKMEIPEIDRGGWFTISDARTYIRAEQEPLLERLREQRSQAE